MDQSYMHLWAAWEWSQATLALFSVAGLSVTGVVAVAYALFKFLGEKWLNQKFAEQLEAYKSEQAQELERLRHKINGIFDRIKRLNDREFETLPEIWATLVEAKSWASGYTSVFQSYPDISKMSDADLDEFLEQNRFSNAQKRDIKHAPKKQDAYIKIHDLYRCSDVIGKLSEASVSLSKYGIFMIPSLRGEMKELIDMIHAAVIEHKINQEHDVRPRMKEAADKLKSEGEPLFKRIEDSVSARLWESTTESV